MRCPASSLNGARLSSVLLACVAASIVGCGGTTHATPPAVTPGSTAAASGTARTAVATIRITVPAATSRPVASTARSPRYVSPATQAIAVSFTSPTVNGGAATSANQNLTAGSPGCTASLVSPLICNVQLSLVPATYTASVTTYDAALTGTAAAIAAGNGTPAGNALSSAQNFSVTVAQGSANTIPITLAGIPTAIALVPFASSALTGSQTAGYSLPRCTTATQAISAVGIDADGNFIVGPGAPTPTLTSSLTPIDIATPTPASPNLFGLSLVNYPAVAAGTLTAQAAYTLGTSPTPAPASATIPFTIGVDTCGATTTLASGFNIPAGVAVDASGTIYVADSNANVIKKVTPAGVVTIVAGDGTAGYMDATGTAAEFNSPTGITLDAAGTIYVADVGNNKLRKIVGGVVTTFASNGGFQYASGVAADPSGNVYVADTGNCLIRKVDTSGNVTTVAGNGMPAEADGIGTAAAFNAPYGVALDSAGNLYVTDGNAGVLRKIAAAGIVTTLATGFAFPYGVTVDGNGSVYVGDTQNNVVKKISAAGVVSVLAGSGTQGTADGFGSAASFTVPYGVAVDRAGDVYVADSGNNSLRVVR